MKNYMERAKTRDYSKSWQLPGTFPELLQKRKPQLGYPDMPISAAENYRRCVEGTGPLWMPQYQWDGCVIWPDAIEEHPVPEEDGRDWWGTEWKNTPNGMAVKPGTRVIQDFADWEKELEWPNLDGIDFASDGAKLQKQLDPERALVYESTEGLFERLHELIPFDEALLMFYEEPDALKRFFDRMADYKIETIEIVCRNYGRVDGVLYHDDWGTQRSGFFSNDMFAEQLMPQTKRIVDRIKSMGLFAELHSCGKNMQYVPHMIEMGFGMWAPQKDVNDFDELYRLYNDKMSFAFAVPFTPDMDENAVRACARGFVDRYGENGRVMAWIKRGSCAPELTAAARDELYLYSREYYAKKRQ